ncbi:MAG: cellulase N-terminal Ig-like domain-containing protein, partial [Synechococcus sp.]
MIQSNIYSVAPNILGIRLNVGSVERGLGTLPDRYLGEEIDVEELLDPSNYRITSNDDPEFINPINLSNGKIYIKTKTNDVAFLRKDVDFFSSPNSLKWTQEHDISIELPSNISFKPGNSYSIDYVGSLNSEIQDIQNFIYQPEDIHSEAIHVSQLGFDPDDPKLAFLSLWRGQDSSGNVAQTPDHFYGNLNFKIVDATTNMQIQNSSAMGVAQLSLEATDDEDFRGGQQNYANTDVFTLDFSNFKTPGEYYIYVDGVGRSFDFTIAENTWEEAFKVSMQGLYNQRSGTAIGGSFSNIEYPRSFHPDDGVLIFPTDSLTTTVNGRQVTVDAVQLIDANQGLNLGNQTF